MSLQKGIELASRPAVVSNWRRCKYLIIDEISMIDGEYFEVRAFKFLGTLRKELTFLYSIFIYFVVENRTDCSSCAEK